MKNFESTGEDSPSGGRGAGLLSLVGAGPGDPDLITLKAIKALKVADVVLYDALASEQLLEYCKPEAELIYVGKRSGDASPRPSRRPSMNASSRSSSAPRVFARWTIRP